MVSALNSTEFESPSKRQMTLTAIDQIKYNLKIKGAGLDYRELFDKAIADEKIGFIGYHGDDLDFLIYQDIIRIIVEDVIEIPVKKDFHFIAIPLSTEYSFQSLEELSSLFVKDKYQAHTIAKNTFPLNFAIYSNHNCAGLNSVINFSKNLAEASLRHRKEELGLLLEKLEMDPQLIETLFDIAYQRLDSKTGVLLQFFDHAISPYAFGNAVSYASYPNGFLAENRLISEYFLDNSSGEFPQELRMVVNVRGVLNPTSPLSIKRYTKIQPNKLKAWEQDLRMLIKAEAFDPDKRDELRQSLLQVWSNK